MFKQTLRNIVPPVVLAAWVILAAMGTNGCSSERGGASAAGGKQTPEATAGAAKATTSSGSASAGKSGVELWADTCSRCHNIRDPASYGDVNWSIAMHHMRVRANLNAEDYRKILAFLKSAD